MLTITRVLQQVLAKVLQQASYPSKMSEGISRKMLKPRTYVIQFLFSEHLTYWFFSLSFSNDRLCSKSFTIVLFSFVWKCDILKCTKEIIYFSYIITSHVNRPTVRKHVFLTRCRSLHFGLRSKAEYIKMLLGTRSADTQYILASW
jgi:hypothetical protein